jgi:UDP-N-acetyl-D-mannosaminuronic acid dehydrogenase
MQGEELMKVCVIGLGYIGLPTAALMARNGNEVVGVDTSKDALARIRKSGGPTEEPGLAKLVNKVLADGSLRLSGKPERADAFILCLPTPVNDDTTADLTYVEKATKSILPYVGKGNLVVLESTVPPGATEKVVGKLLAKAGLNPRTDVDVAHAPERVLPGKIMEELVNLDRVMGGLTPRATERVSKLYASFVKGKMMLTDATTAEFVKLIENSYRDVNIAFANELATLAELLGIDVWEAIGIANHHPRVNIHRPGPGVGGHCIAVDPYFLIEIAGGRAKLMAQARQTNSSMPAFVVARAEKMLGSLKGKRVAVLGIAYKGNVGDPRESPSLEVLAQLERRGAKCAAHDPYVTKTPVKLVSLDVAVKGADLVVIATDHRDYISLDPRRLGKLVKGKRILDTRHILDGGAWEKAGWEVAFLGNGKLSARAANRR